MKALFFIALLPLLTPAVQGGDYRDLEDGATLFRIYCTGCHGEKGRGDGPAAPDLETRPPDLTRLSEKHDGGFPREAMIRWITGMDREPGHRSVEMPLWGFTFRDSGSDADQQEAIRNRIHLLVDYLESIQNRK